MITDYIIPEIRENIGIITLNNPQTLNSINKKMMQELSEQLLIFDQNEQVRVIVIKGIEQAFAAGLDIKDFAIDSNEAKKSLQEMQENFALIFKIKKPLIAAVSGFALGTGCEIALACDIVLATDDAKFGLPELSLGLLPCFGGCSLLVKRVGKAKAMDMILTGRAMLADEAEQCGLISRVVSAESLEEEYIKVARRISAIPQEAVVAAKKVISEHSVVSHMSYENLFSLNYIESESFRQNLQIYASKKAI